jgi:hypothetical protein
MLDFEMTLGDEMWPVRVELYQGIVDKSWFRCRVWQAENYRIQSTFPCDSSGKPQHDPSDEVILVDWSTSLPEELEWFQAETPERAIAHVLASILSVIERITGESGG